jgi:hypothetical protein
VARNCPCHGWTAKPGQPTGRTGAGSAADSGSTVSCRDPRQQRTWLYHGFRCLSPFWRGRGKQGRMPVPRPCDMPPSPSACSTTIHGKTSTVPDLTSIHQFIPQLSQLDPALRPSLRCYSGSIRKICNMKAPPSILRKERALADLVVIAFFFLLRVGEYTRSTNNQRNQTTQIPVDMQFGKYDQIAWRNPDLSQLKVRGITTSGFSNYNPRQAEWSTDATLHHDALPSNPLCPVSEPPARRFVHVRTCDPLNSYPPSSAYMPHTNMYRRHRWQGHQTRH